MLVHQHIFKSVTIYLSVRPHAPVERKHAKEFVSTEMLAILVAKLIITSGPSNVTSSSVHQGDLRNVMILPHALLHVGEVPKHVQELALAEQWAGQDAHIMIKLKQINVTRIPVHKHTLKNATISAYVVLPAMAVCARALESVAMEMSATLDASLVDTFAQNHAMTPLVH